MTKANTNISDEIFHVNYIGKVEKLLKDSLESIPSPSPSVKIQIVGGKVCFRCKSKTLLGIVNKLLKTKSLLTSSSNVFALIPEVNFPANNLNFHWRLRDQIHALFICSTLKYIFNTNLGNRNSLLFHNFMDSSTILISHLVKFVNAANSLKNKIIC